MTNENTVGNAAVLTMEESYKKLIAEIMTFEIAETSTQIKAAKKEAERQQQNIVKKQM